MTQVLKLVFRFIQKIAEWAGYNLVLDKKNKKRDGLNLNVGCGNYLIEGFVSLDIFTSHYHGDRKKRFVQYDLRKDSMPYDRGTVDNIYVSHVIEHIETVYVERFVKESFRVLKKGGVLRLACPDAKFLYEVSCFDNDYWKWRINWFRGDNAKKHIGAPLQMDFFIREIATPRSKFYVNSIPFLEIEGKNIEKWAYKDVVEDLTHGLVFREEYPGDHINAWDYDRLEALGQNVGFSHVIRSKYGGSVSMAMQGPDIDRTYPQMTLYVEMIK